MRLRGQNAERDEPYRIKCSSCGFSGIDLRVQSVGGGEYGHRKYGWNGERSGDCSCRQPWGYFRGKGDGSVFIELPTLRNE